MTELSLLSNDELLYLKYIILREASNYSNNYIMATRFDNQISKLKITNKKDLKIDFKDYEKVIYKILLNKTSDINIDLLTDKDKRELIDLLDKVIYIFSINKEENINKYNELELYKKQIFKTLKKYNLKEILSLLDNPLDMLNVTCKSDEMRSCGQQEKLKLNNGEIHNALFESVARGTTPNFPYVIEIATKDKSPLKIAALMRAENDSYYKVIPSQMGDEK